MTLTAPANPPVPNSPIRVMIVDDSAVIRGLIARTLEGAGDVEIAVTVADGRQAIAALARHPVDVIVLDIEMPEMDGLSAIPFLLEKAPHAKIIMASTLTLKNADVTLKALAAGAADYVPKPTSSRDMMGPAAFNRELLEKVRSLGAVARSGRPAHSTDRRLSAVPARRALLVEPPSQPVLRAASTMAPQIIAMGSSTGGPQALYDVLKHLAPTFNLPILLTQHMPPTFTTMLAHHITRICGVDAVEATDGMPVERGRIHIAPGDFHMKVTNTRAAPVIRLTKEPPENYCRPSVDPMMTSIVDIYGPAVLAVILTGMGHDGLRGCRAVVAAGGSVIGQDQATSVVWGMPGAVANAGLCSSILPIDQIGPKLRTITLPRA
ncbi:MAG TPA: chemotaxis response regulator protein-glutamate methylesterase [Alphaproteobacteria bacterium]|nr:chemotaxis response regulator protein-glutamate methylesterase [Alphaproteobacteria bacterium]